jgi:hypothetical protein
MRINHLAVALLIATTSIGGHAQDPDSSKINNLVTAISHAEGFGVPGTIPSRYHNPGDLRAGSDPTPWAGQVRVGKAGHIVFKDDEAGIAALRDCVTKMIDGRSHYFHSNMTFSQVARRYAEDWRPWVRIVSMDLGVSPNTTLRAYFHGESSYHYETPHHNESPHTAAPPLRVEFRPMPAVNPAPLPPTVGFRESSTVLDAMLDVAVNVPPLVQEDAPQRHRKLPHLHLHGTSDEQTVSSVRLVTDPEKMSWR